MSVAVPARHRQAAQTTMPGGVVLSQGIMQARVLARARFSELARLHRSRHNDAERLEREIEAGDAEVLAEAVEECGLREDWRTVREEQCTTRVLNDYTARRQDAAAFEVAAAAVLAEHHAQGVGLEHRPGTSGGLPWPLTVGVGKLVEQSRAHFKRPFAEAQRKLGGGGGVPSEAASGLHAAATAGAAASASASAATAAAAAAPAMPAAATAMPAKRPMVGASRRTDHASLVLGSLMLAWCCKAVAVPQQRVRRTQRREAATTIARYVRLWLRLRVAAKNWVAPKSRPAVHGDAAAMIQRCWRGHCGRQTAAKMASWANIRARRARRREWETVCRPGHQGAAEIYEQLAVGAWHVAKEQRRIVKEKERERRVFEAAFKSWDKQMTRAVMMKPLHDDWVPQMGGADGKPTSYYNVRTQVRVPFHPREYSYSFLFCTQSVSPQLPPAPFIPSQRASWAYSSLPARQRWWLCS